MNSLLKEIDQLQKEIELHKPLEKRFLQKIKEYYKIGLTYSSNALEGNSLTETETKIILEEGITIGGKPLKDHYEAVGHGEAFDLLYSLLKKKYITELEIKKLHHAFYQRIDEKHAGKYRKNRALITGSKYPLPDPLDLPSLMKELPEKIQSYREKNHPAVASALAHKEFVFIHPFVDGNGRVARLLMNLLLLQENLSLAVIPPIARKEYIETLEKAHTEDHDFICLILRMIRETQRDYLRLFSH